MTTWSKGDLVTIRGVVADEADEVGDVRVNVEAPARRAVGLPTRMIYCVPGSVLRRADDGVADAIRERDEARSERDNARADIVILKTERDRARAERDAALQDCDGLRAVCDEYQLKLREARARDDAAVAHDALAERDEAKAMLDAALRLIGERALREYMDGGER